MGGMGRRSTPHPDCPLSLWSPRWVLGALVPCERQRVAGGRGSWAPCPLAAACMACVSGAAAAGSLTGGGRHCLGPMRVWSAGRRHPRFVCSWLWFRRCHLFFYVRLPVCPASEALWLPPPRASCSWLPLRLAQLLRTVGAVPVGARALRSIQCCVRLFIHPFPPVFCQGSQSHLLGRQASSFLIPVSVEIGGTVDASFPG